MAEQDSLSGFDFDKVTGPSIWLRFKAGHAVTIRVLTIDPLVTNDSFVGRDGEDVVTTKFSFLVYNFTDGQAQILQVGPGIARQFASFQGDTEFGANIRELDIKITPTGEGLKRRYEVQVLPKARVMTQAQVEEALKIKLEDKVENGFRLSEFDSRQASPSDDVSQVPPEDDLLDGGEPINLDDIPFS